MMTKGISDSAKSQSDKFKDAAREHGCDEDEARWAERLKKVAKPSDRKINSGTNP
jgi:hypothetical protein